MEEQFMSADEPVEDSSAAAMPMPAPQPTLAPPAPMQHAIKLPARKLAGTAIARVVPTILYQMNRIGPTGVAGSALFLFAGIFFFSAVLPQYAQIAALRESINHAQLTGNSDPAPRVRLSRFVENLPKRSELPAIAGQVFKLAAVAGVTLDRGHYEFAPLHSGHLARYRMTFPIKGRYPDIRHFIDATLRAVPSAAIDGLRIERKNAGDDTVNADLRFTVFVRNES
jgi:hypothetical protein